MEFGQIFGRFSKHLEETRIFSPTDVKEYSKEKAVYLYDETPVKSLARVQALEQIIQNDVYYEMLGSQDISDVSENRKNYIPLSKTFKQFE